MSDRHNMGKPCPKCGDHMAKIEPKGDQQVARCATCNQYLKNVPKGELGVPTRSTRTGKIKPKQRQRILERDNHTCWSCGASAPTVLLEVDHTIPAADWHLTGLPDALLDDDRNLGTLCKQCNGGKSDELTIGAVRALFRRQGAA